MERFQNIFGHHNRLNKYSWRKNAWGLFCPQYVCYGKPLKKHGSESFALFVAEKHCGRFIVKGNRFYTSKATKILRGSDHLAGSFEFYFDQFG